MARRKPRNWLDTALDKGLIACVKATDPAAVFNSGTMSELKEEVWVPPPPSTNHLFATAGKRRVKTREYREWLSTAVPKLALLKKPSLPCELHLYLIGKWNERRDGSNTVKAVEDALVAAGVIPDDSLEYVRREVWSYDAADCDPEVRVRFGP